MRYEIVLTEDAERDLEEIHGYVATSDSPQKADHLLTRLLELAATLETAPARGVQPRELRAVGDQEFRQVLFKPYRVIYRVIDRRVVIYLSTDGRRDMTALLTRRLLNA